MDVIVVMMTVRFLHLLLYTQFSVITHTLSLKKRQQKKKPNRPPLVIYKRINCYTIITKSFAVLNDIPSTYAYSVEQLHFYSRCDGHKNTHFEIIIGIELKIRFFCY